MIDNEGAARGNGLRLRYFLWQKAALSGPAAAIDDLGGEAGDGRERNAGREGGGRQAQNKDQQQAGGKECGGGQVGPARQPWAIPLQILLVGVQHQGDGVKRGKGQRANAVQHGRGDGEKRKGQPGEQAGEHDQETV